MSSNQRPDTLMQGHVCQIDENLLQRTAGPYMWVKTGASLLGPHVRFRQEQTLKTRTPDPPSNPLDHRLRAPSQGCQFPGEQNLTRGSRD